VAILCREQSVAISTFEYKEKELSMKRKRFEIFIALFLFLFLSHSYPSKPSVEKLLEEIFSISSPSGYENAMVEKIQQILPREFLQEQDNLGSLYFTFGKGKPRLALLASMDEIGYFVSGIDSQGYLLLDRAVPAPHRLYDSFHQGHQVIVWTKNGSVPGVLSLPSVHILSRERRAELQGFFSLDSAYLDIGACSEEAVRKKGVEVLDAVTTWPELTKLAGEKKAGRSLGNKTFCSLLLALGREFSSKKLSKETTLVWVAQTKFQHRGSRPRAAMGALIAKNKLQADKVIILDIVPVDRESQYELFLGKGPVLVQPKKVKSEFIAKIEEIAGKKNIPLQYQPGFQSTLMNPFLSGDKEVITLGLPVKFSSTLVEIVDFKDVQALEKLLYSLLQ